MSALVAGAALAITVNAQQARLQVVQDSSGTLYLVQGGNQWILVPDQISDTDLAALNPNGEVDRIIWPFLTSQSQQSIVTNPVPTPLPSTPSGPGVIGGKFRVSVVRMQRPYNERITNRGRLSLAQRRA